MSISRDWDQGYQHTLNSLCLKTCIFRVSFLNQYLSDFHVTGELKSSISIGDWDVKKYAKSDLHI